MTKRYYKYKETHRKFRGVKQKRCVKCMKWKRQSVREFCRDSSKKDGLRIYCKECDKAYGYEYREKNRSDDVREYLRFEQRHRVVNGIEEKLCSKCGNWKEKKEFYRSKGSKDELATRCIECSMEQKGGRPRRRNLRNAERNRVYRGVKQKLCSGCNQWKPRSDFHKNRLSRDGLGHRCKECHGEQARERYRKRHKGARKYVRHEDRHRVVRGVREKLCAKCGQWKKEDDYHRQRSSKDGLSGWCKKCSYQSGSKSPGKKR